jgi:cardiolipin synthase C
MVFDREAVYLGSMNLDPRSVVLNTEVGLLIHSEALAGQVAEFIERAMAPDLSYRVRLNPDSDLIHNPLLWHENEDGIAVRHDRDPQSGFFRRLLIDILSGLPIESQL